MKKVGNILNKKLNETVVESVAGMLNDEDIAQYVLSLLQRKKKKFNSTSNLRHKLTSGYPSIKWFISGSSIQ